MARTPAMTSLARWASIHRLSEDLAPVFDSRCSCRRLDGLTNANGGRSNTGLKNLSDDIYNQPIDPSLPQENPLSLSIQAAALSLLFIQSCCVKVCYRCFMSIDVYVPDLAKIRSWGQQCLAPYEAGISFRTALCLAKR